ncbi:hypothetical protein [Dokdonia sp.]|uniref:hypothetical protein n=1 Tax=Dokdonia sp. TaxID=2024995 RepID=UPI003262EFF7
MILIVLVCIQCTTYYLFGKKNIIYPIGKHYETFVFFSENEFEEIFVGANAPLEEEKVVASFPIFAAYKLELCEALPNKCIEEYDWNKKGRYHYFFEIKTGGVFAIHTIAEFEHATQYGASWESHYVWVLFKWILIKKENRGIS